jgi:hypothetical protein
MMWPEFTFPCNADKTPRQKEWQRGVFQNVAWRRAELVGALTGPRNGFDVLDIDPHAVGWYAANFGRIPQTRRHETRRFVHLLFRHAPGLRCSDGKIADGVDVRADGGYAIWWPREGFGVDDWPLADWPEWLLELARAPKRNGVAGGPRVYPSTVKGVEQWRANVRPEDAALATRALFMLPVHEWRGKHDEWLTVMQGAKFAGVSEDDFVRWSLGDEFYADHEEKIRRKWASLAPWHDGGFQAALAKYGIKLGDRRCLKVRCRGEGSGAVRLEEPQSRPKHQGGDE